MYKYINVNSFFVNVGHAVELYMYLFIVKLISKVAQNKFKTHKPFLKTYNNVLYSQTSQIFHLSLSKVSVIKFFFSY